MLKHYWSEIKPGATSFGRVIDILGTPRRLDKKKKEYTRTLRFIDNLEIEI